MRNKRWLILLASLGVILLANSVGGTMASFVDQESSSGHTFEAWTSVLWQQTTQAHFEDGVLNNVDTSSSARDVKLEIVSQEPTTSVGSKESWYFASWSRRAPVTISNSGSGLTDYQVKVDVTYDADMKPDFDDIRFVDSDDSTELSHWRESYTASTSAIFWVKVPSIPSGDKTIYMYYGNSAASSNSDGDATFVFFDDFSGDLSKWNVHIDTDVAITSGYGNPAPCLEISGGVTSSPYGFAVIGSNATYSTFQNGIIEADVYPAIEALPEIIFRGNYASNTGYKGRWDCRSGTESPWMKPPYSGWAAFGTAVTRFGIANQWQKAKLIINGSTFEIYSNGNLKSSVTDTQYSEPGEIALANHYGTYARFDNIRVRKYADPEPTTSVGTEDGWSRRALVTINNPSSGLTDYQVKVDVTYDADMKPDFDDIRFRDSDDSTELSHWRESYIASASAIFWIKVPSIPSGDKTIYMYYGNDAASSASDGDATFAFFDDFPGTSLDVSKWQSAGTVTVAGSEVHIHCNANGQGIGVVIPDYLFGLGYSVEYRERFGETNVVHLIQGAYQLYDGQHHGTVFSALADGTGRARTANDSVMTETILGLYDTSYHRYQITRISGEAKYYYEGILLATHTTNVPPDDLRVQFTGDNTADIYLEWVFVRKYAPQSTYVSPGTIASQVLDTGVAGANWDALFWDETLPSNTDITFEVRASDTLFAKGDASPSWTSVGETSPVTEGLPSGRYMQWRATLTTSDTSETPTLNEVRVYYY